MSDQLDDVPSEMRRVLSLRKLATQAPAPKAVPWWHIHWWRPTSTLNAQYPTMRPDDLCRCGMRRRWAGDVPVVTRD